MKRLKIAIWLSIWLSKWISCQDLEGGDINIVNLSSSDIWVRAYPVSMVFNADLYNFGNYDFHTRDENASFDYINGRGIPQDGKQFVSKNPPSNTFQLLCATIMGIFFCLFITD